jgi:hypothetical protein
MHVTSSGWRGLALASGKRLPRFSHHLRIFPLEPPSYLSRILSWRLSSTFSTSHPHPPFPPILSGTSCVHLEQRTIEVLLKWFRSHFRVSLSSAPASLEQFLINQLFEAQPQSWSSEFIVLPCDLSNVRVSIYGSFRHPSVLGMPSTVSRR